MRLLLLSLLAISTTAFSQEKDRFSKWDGDMARFEAADKAAMPAKQSVLFVGSSSIRMWDLDTSWPEMATINRGFGGSTLADSIHFFDQVIKKYQPRAIAIYAGDNDIKAGLTAEETVDDFKKLKAKIDEALPGTPVIYIAIKPSISRWNIWPTMKAANDGIKAVCESDPLYHFADIASPMLANEQPPPADLFAKDGLHLSAKGYEMWKDVIDPLIPEIK